MPLLCAVLNDRGHACVVGLNCRREGAQVRAATVLCDGGTPAGVYPAVWITDHNKRENVTLRLPALEDGTYEDETFEVLEWQKSER